MIERPFIATAFPLQQGILFHIELYENRLRLVIRKDGEEWICRKESFRNLYAFLKTEDSRLFKGRLQLVKQQQQVQIIAKGTAIGSMAADWLKDRLDALQASFALTR
jgi:hypothetical protein